MGSCNGMAFFTSNFMSVHETPHEDQDHHHHPPTSQLINTLLPSCSPQDFHGVASLLGKRSMSFSGFEVCHDQETNNGDDDYSDDGSQIGEKKRRLNMEQVKTLEKNFELGNKLEPERKMQLARALGLQPRQIAIWFQNRRARWKTKQLEKDYDLLKRQFEAMKADNDALQAQNKKLHAEILALKSRGGGGEVPTEFIINLNNKETEGSSSNRSENSSELNLDISTTQPAIDSPPLSSSHQHHHQHQHHHHPSLFSSSIIRPNHHHHLAQQYPKIEPTTNVQEDQSFTNMFCGIDDQPNFWPWQEQQQFH